MCTQWCSGNSLVLELRKLGQQKTENEGMGQQLHDDDDDDSDDEGNDDDEDADGDHDDYQGHYDYYVTLLGLVGLAPGFARQCPTTGDYYVALLGSVGPAPGNALLLRP